MSNRDILRVASWLAVVCVLLAPACGGRTLDLTPSSDDAGRTGAPGTSPPCNDTTCPTGCCDASGQCQPGSAATACGNGGGSCQNCIALGAQCTTIRTCLREGPDAGRCNASNCPLGCCDMFGACQPGLSGSVCGAGGVTCQNCVLRGQQCSSQRCVAVPDGGACNAATCPQGCCDALGQCQPGASAIACGNFGNRCQSCSDTCLKGTCGNFRDSLEAGPPLSSEAGGCGAAGCPTGCCDPLGQCRLGSLNTQCGGSGTLCRDCTSFGEQCSSQICVSLDAGACNVQTCPAGCCDVSGQCQQGVTGTACGNFAAACQNCLQQGEVCSAQQCRP